MPKLKNSKSKNKKAVVRTIGKMRPDKEPRSQNNFQQRFQQRQIDDEIQSMLPNNNEHEQVNELTTSF